MVKNIILLCITIFYAHGAPLDENNWNGKWFPHSPDEPDLNPEVDISKNDLHDSHHGIVMGVKDATCDDGQTNLLVDWFLDSKDYTCYEDKRLYLPRSNVHPMHSTDHIPDQYEAIHKCMNESIEYNSVIPTFGNHRPLWAVYGEYTFLPKQRWLHNLEHGAVVMLYHPCAEKNQVNALKALVKSCLRKHIITPYDQLTPERPLALVTWGHLLEMSKVAPDVVVDFIMKHGLKGPEVLHRNGQYDLMLEKEAQIVSTYDDSKLCPKYQEMETM